MGYSGIDGPQQLKRDGYFKGRRAANIFKKKLIKESDLTQKDMGGLDKRASSLELEEIREKSRLRRKKRWVKMSVIVGLSTALIVGLLNVFPPLNEDVLWSKTYRETIEQRGEQQRVYSSAEYFQKGMEVYNQEHFPLALTYFKMASSRDTAVFQYRFYEALTLYQLSIKQAKYLKETERVVQELVEDFPNESTAVGLQEEVLETFY